MMGKYCTRGIINAGVSFCGDVKQSGRIQDKSFGKFRGTKCRQ